MAQPDAAGLDAFVARLQSIAIELAAGADWENRTLPDYLDALAAWLQDCPGLYENLGRPLPSNPWELLIEALEGAKIYE